MRNNLKPWLLIMALLPLNMALAEAKSQLMGTSKNSTNIVKFRTIDQGEILLDEDFNLPDSVTVSSGSHKLSVMCEFNTDFGKTMVPGHGDITVKGGKKYLVSGQLSKDQKTCVIALDEITDKAR